MRISTAVSMLVDHAVYAAITPDGLLAVHSGGDFHARGALDDSTVFSIDDAGCVNTGQVCRWLGY